MRSAEEMNPEAAAGSPAESDHKEYMERPAGPEAAVVLYVSQNPESEAFHTIRDAIRHAEEHSGHPIVIQIAPGIYREHLVIRTRGLTLRGETRENAETFCTPDEGKEKEAAASSFRNEVRITGSLGGYEILEDGIKRGTFRTQTVLITADDVTLENLTIENAAGPAIWPDRRSRCTPTPTGSAFTECGCSGSRIPSLRDRYLKKRSNPEASADRPNHLSADSAGCIFRNVMWRGISISYSEEPAPGSRTARFSAGIRIIRSRSGCRLPM